MFSVMAMMTHPGVFCDGCRGPVVGIRYKCTVCPNYDLCEVCQSQRIHYYHQMFQIPHPNQHPHQPIALPSAQCHPGYDHNYVHPQVMCDGCRGPVIGVRYNCTSCPNYDLCVQCKSTGLHSHHLMRDIYPQDYQNSSQVPGYDHLPGIPTSSDGLLLPTYPYPCTYPSYHYPEEPTSFNANNATDELERLFEEKLDVGQPRPSLPLPDPGKKKYGKESKKLGKTGKDPFTARWSPAQSGVPFKRQRLDSSDQEYKDVISNIMAMGGKKWKGKIQKICRIENHGMYKIYKACKDQMDKVNGSGFANESILWHGTSVDVLNNIYRGGFNRSYCGKNATAYGDGVYFAKSIEYSASPKYSPPDAKGQKYIFQCRVLTGHFVQGKKGLKEPPMRTDELRYDSVVDEMTNPKMFVIFKDMQVYPEYVVTLQV